MFPKKIRIFVKYLGRSEIAEFQYAIGNVGYYKGVTTGTIYQLDLRRAWRHAVE